MVKNYTPEKGDIVMLNFHPQAGREQDGIRPALVISPKLYNQKSGLAILCPITSKVKGYPFEVTLPKNLKTKGVVLSDHLKSLDWHMRKSKFLEKIPENSLKEVLQKIFLLMF